VKQWKINEKIAYEWVKKNLDSKAVLHGGSISNAPDITLSNGDIYEVKSVEAQCGQFTAKTAYKYKYSDDVQEYFLGIYGRDLEPKETFYLNDHPICKAWVKAYYKDIKKVKAFLVVEHGKVTEQSLEDYFNNHVFKCTYRFKKSGSESNIPEWAVKLLPKHWECINDVRSIMLLILMFLKKKFMVLILEESRKLFP